MKYAIVIEKLAEKFIVKLPQSEKERVLKAIYKLPDGNDIKELQGKKNFFHLHNFSTSSCYIVFKDREQPDVQNNIIPQEVTYL